MSVEDVADYLGVPQRTIRSWAENGKIRALRRGQKAWRFRPIDVEAFSLRLGFRPAAPPAVE
jgi:excisionase family DNA binding protein